MSFHQTRVENSHSTISILHFLCGWSHNRIFRNRFHFFFKKKNMAMPLYAAKNVIIFLTHIFALFVHFFFPFISYNTSNTYVSFVNVFSLLHYFYLYLYFCTIWFTFSLIYFSSFYNTNNKLFVLCFISNYTKKIYLGSVWNT